MAPRAELRRERSSSEEALLNGFEQQKALHAQQLEAKRGLGGWVFEWTRGFCVILEWLVLCRSMGEVW